MLGPLFLACLFLALLTARNGSVAVWALAGSAALTSVLSLLGVPFDIGLWLLIDAAVIAAVEKFGQVREVEAAIFALFPPAWVLYQLQPEGWRDVVMVIVALQFLLTVPWDRLEQHVWKARVA